ncbi:hypothetical protein [Flavobacterium sp. 14A]|uniref:hypothetical protein n=1 Tax=Flavobacterium sp. 14A TaxID=2735896 RepID=UPI0015700FAA|nr:hypothetical protein [Flavobacterium sp. 14A]NRT12966.1 hypothetical protein [Flavobacterium sp. 14A]
MKLTRDLKNGILIYVGIGIYFLIMQALNLSDLYYMRMLNIVFIFYFTNLTLKSNYNDGKNSFPENAKSALTTSLTGVILSILSLAIYSDVKGGNKYIESLSDSFLFGGEPTIASYCTSLLFEGIVSAVIVSFTLLLFWKRRYPSES